MGHQTAAAAICFAALAGLKSALSSCNLANLGRNRAQKSSSFSQTKFPGTFAHGSLAQKATEQRKAAIWLSPALLSFHKFTNEAVEQHETCPQLHPAMGLGPYLPPRFYAVPPSPCITDGNGPTSSITDGNGPTA